MKTIVLGYDDNEPSKRALERTAQLAKAFGSELIVASVAPIVASAARSAGPIDQADPPERHVEELAHAREYLDSQGISAQYRTGVGEPADTILELAEERGADLIVIGTREPNFLQRVLGQSVSDAISHKAHRDVLIVH